MSQKYCANLYPHFAKEISYFESSIHSIYSQDTTIELIRNIGSSWTVHSAID